MPLLLLVRPGAREWLVQWAPVEAAAVREAGEWTRGRIVATRAAVAGQEAVEREVEAEAQSRLLSLH